MKMSSENSEQAYRNYLTEHISNVQRAYKENFQGHFSQYPELGPVLKSLIANHDASKYQNDEFEPYRAYFYPTEWEDSSNAEYNFDNAWRLHQHRNPHHWQHWVLIEDSGTVTALDMPIKYVIEIICDWHSFSYKYPESTARQWYTDNKDNMILSEATADWIDHYLDMMEN
jgi:hypothetical protein